MTKNLLLELLVEELPPKALKRLGESFACSLHDSLKAQGLVTEESVVMSYASPRRLATTISHVAERGEDKQVAQKLMPVAVGLDANGAPTPALLKKLAAFGADASALPSLKRVTDGKAEVLMMDNTVKGASLAEALQKALEQALSQLPIPKLMTYQLRDGWTTVNFVRPAHKLVALHGDAVVPVSVLGLHAGRETLGHRFEAKSASIQITNADSYADQLEREGAVIASFADRRAEISMQLRAAAQKCGEASGQVLTPIQDDALLDEVTALVERPNVLIGQFEERFLEVPQECLILTMKANQKYFPLLSGDGKLTNKFLIVSNIRPSNASAVVGGNERVVRPRLADAKFFFDQDRKKTLESRIPGLAKVVYHNKLGTQGERIERVRQLARQIASELAPGGTDALAEQAELAAKLAKADLLTDMVGEFPELQGIMGAYYARHEGLPAQVADAIEDHYKPRFAGDALPRNTVGIVVALADKLETLAGLFGIGQIPSGDKDPFALRRHALGVIRMLIEKDLPLALPALLEMSFAVFPSGMVSHASDALSNFLLDRLAGYLKELGYTANEVDAVIQGPRPAVWADLPKRLAAVRAFAALPEAASLAAANKRVGNILKKADIDLAKKVDVSLLKEPAEQALQQALADLAPRADAAFEAGDYSASLQALAGLKEPVDAFFDKVMVNAEDAALRANRLALLQGLQRSMNRVADIARLST